MEAKLKVKLKTRQNSRLKTWIKGRLQYDYKTYTGSVEARYKFQRLRNIMTHTKNSLLTTLKKIL